jgi:hypothetical protein
MSRPDPNQIALATLLGKVVEPTLYEIIRLYKLKPRKGDELKALLALEAAHDALGSFRLLGGAAGGIS